MRWVRTAWWGWWRPRPAGYREISRFEIAKGGYPTWSQPVIANGKLYLRDQDNLFCYNVKK